MKQRGETRVRNGIYPRTISNGGDGYSYNEAIKMKNFLEKLIKKTSSTILEINVTINPLENEGYYVYNSSKYY